MSRKQKLSVVIGRNLSDKIKARGWSQSEFARRTDELKMSISFFCRGKRLPSIERLQKFADVLGCAVSTLLKD